MTDTGELPVSCSPKIFIVHDGAVLAFQKSAGDLNFGSLWDLPGGEPEAGEGEIEALKRSVWEECGLQIAVGAPFAEAEFLHPPKKPQRRVQVEAFLGVPESDPANLQPRTEYVSAIKWITFANLPRTKFIPGLLPLIDAFAAKFID